jgi:pimeloyl-ACP methyl ester carboxylesterase
MSNTRRGFLQSSAALAARLTGVMAAEAQQARPPEQNLPARRRPWIWAVIGLVVVVLVVVVYVKLANSGIIPNSRVFDVKVAYVGAQAPYNKSVAVVFVHGVFGTKNDTWLNQGSSFPALLASDPEFRNQADVFLFEYFTPKFGSAATIAGLAGQLRGTLEDHRVFEDHKSVVFLSHSMGGLVVRQYLLTRHDLGKIAMLYFYATPTNGSELTTTAQELSSNPQLRGMLPLEGNDLLQSIQDGWLQWDEAKRVPSYCAFETLQTFGVWVVTQSSAAALCNQPLDPISANHIDIVKPADRGDPRYSRFATALRKSLPVVKAGAMDDFESPAAWRRNGDVWSHRGPAFLAYKMVPHGVFQFTVQLVKGGNLFHSGRIRWCLNYHDSKNYALFELNNQNFWAKDVSNGKSTDHAKTQLNLNTVKMFTVQVEVKPQQIVHTILIDGKWVSMNSWTDNDRNFTDGKFGFLVQGSDEISISDFKFTPQ